MKTKMQLIQAVHKANTRNDKPGYEAALKELGAFVYATEFKQQYDGALESLGKLAYEQHGNPYPGA